MNISYFEEVSQIVADVYLIQAKYSETLKNDEALIVLVTNTFAISFGEYISSSMYPEDFKKSIIDICAFYRTVGESEVQMLTYGIKVFLNAILPANRHLTQEEVFSIIDDNTNIIASRVGNRLLRQSKPSLEALLKVAEYKKSIADYNKQERKQARAKEKRERKEEEKVVDERIQRGKELIEEQVQIVEDKEEESGKEELDKEDRGVYCGILVAIYCGLGLFVIIGLLCL